MEEYPDEILLSTGAAFHLGGCDKTGHPLVIFPTQQQAAFTNMPPSDVIQLLHYFKLIVPVQQKLNGFAYLINLQSASNKTITQLATSLNTLQLTSEGLVHCLYVIKPKASKNVKLLEKLTGLQSSKKNPVRNLYQVHILKDFASLHRNVDKIFLTEEFGGHQHFNVTSWVQFRLQVDNLTGEISRCQSVLEESKDQMHILCELEIPTTSEESQPLLDSINAKYASIMGELKLEHVIDNCASILEELNPSKIPVKYAQGDLLRDVIKHIRTSQRELTEAREQLQLQWRQALARVVQASQLKVHQKNANKITKWIDRNGNALLTDVSQPIISHKQVNALLEKTKDLSTTVQELQKEADYIQTDVQYMALQDASEFSQSLQAIEKMKSAIDKFTTDMAVSDTRLNSASAVFSNIAKCYGWYSDFLTSLPKVSDAADFLSICSECLERVKDRAPPNEWLGYIESKLESVNDDKYWDNASALTKRIYKIYGLNSDAEEQLSLREVNEWIAALDFGFEGLSKSMTAVQDNPPTAKLSNGKKSAPSSRKATAPKLRGAYHAPDSSTDDIDETVATNVRHKRPTKSRRSPPSKDLHNNSKEVYIDLTDVTEVRQLPQSLSHINMEKFLENEPADNALASSTPVNGLDRSTESTVKVYRDSETKLPPSTDTSHSSPLHISTTGKKKKKKKYRLRRDNDTDDSCPALSDYLSTTGTALLSTSSSSGIPGSACVPQNYNLPYNPVSHKERLEHIYRSSSPTLEQKLDMMVSLIEEGDDSCFDVRTSKNHVTSDVTDQASFAQKCKEQRPVGRLTPANISRELCADVTYPEHIYHWLRRQNDENFSSREVVGEVRDDTNSLKDCIQRAEKILEEGLPIFHHTEGTPSQPNPYFIDRLGRANNDITSKSGDSGITELTTRDLLLSNRHQRYASRESGLESDITGYTATSSEPYHRSHNGARPKQVPPLWLNKPYTRRSRSPQRLRVSRLHQQTTSQNEAVSSYATQVM